jgi:hypothetical protein
MEWSQMTNNGSVMTLMMTIQIYLSCSESQGTSCNSKGRSPPALSSSFCYAFVGTGI